MTGPLNILITGSNGQLGQSFKIIDRLVNGNFIFADRKILDICNSSALTSFIAQNKPDVIINCAAYTNVNQAHAEADLAFNINANAAGNLAKICRQNNIRFFHVSTDYVFDGTKHEAYIEDDTCNPINTYGSSKQAGEEQVMLANPAAVIIRTSWVFSQFGSNFVKTMLDLAKSQTTIKLIDDQIGGPSWASHIAAVIDKLIYLPPDLVPGGIYHFSGYPWLSWHDFAKEIFYSAKEYGVLDKIPELIAINSTDWPSPEPRPQNSRLDCSKLINLFYTANIELKKQAIRAGLKA